MLPAITIIGGADSGKSTLIGTLLIETESIPKNLIKRVKDLCKKENLVFEPAYLVDYIKEELVLQSTRERALAELKINNSKILIIDTPGQMMLSKKMISGLSEASTAVILVDMSDSDIGKYRYYLKLLSLLGFSDIVVAVNKLDLFGYKEREFKNFLKKIGIKKGKNFHIVPISALNSQNLTEKPELMGWHKGDCLLKALEKILKAKKIEKQKDFLMPVQSVLEIGKEKFALGSVISGQAAIRDSVFIFSDLKQNFPKKTRVKNIFHGNRKTKQAFAGESIGLVFENSGLEIKKGDVICSSDKINLTGGFNAGVYVLETFSLDNLSDYRVRFLKGEYKFKNFKIKKRFNFRLEELDNSENKIFANEFLDAGIKLDKKIVNYKNIVARRFVVENKNGVIAAIGLVQ